MVWVSRLSEWEGLHAHVILEFAALSKQCVYLIYSPPNSPQPPGGKHLHSHHISLVYKVVAADELANYVLTMYTSRTHKATLTLILNHVSRQLMSVSLIFTPLLSALFWSPPTYIELFSCWMPRYMEIWQWSDIWKLLLDFRVHSVPIFDNKTLNVWIK